MHDGERKKGQPVSTNYRRVKIGQEEKNLPTAIASEDGYSGGEGEVQALPATLLYLIMKNTFFSF